MVKIAAALALAMMASLGSSTSFLLTTRLLLQNGKVTDRSNQFFVYDNNNGSPCAGSKYQSNCAATPKYTGTKISSCSASYNGTQPYKDTVGFFENNSGDYVTDGVVGADKKDGTSFGYNVTRDSHCQHFACETGNANRTVIFSFKGFKCTT